jgi:hypothetical protein
MHKLLIMLIKTLALTYRIDSAHRRVCLHLLFPVPSLKEHIKDTMSKMKCN